MSESNSNQEHTANHGSQDHDSTHNDYIKNEFLRFLLGLPSRHLYFLGFVVLAICWFIFILKPGDKINIKDFSFEKGAIIVNAKKMTHIYMSLSPNSGMDSKWIDTEIEVKEGENIQIESSGKINIALNNLVSSVKNDRKSKFPWNDPDGVPEKYDYDPWYPNAGEYKIMPDQPFGKLIAAIKNDYGNIKLYPIGKHGKFIIKSDGKLLLTVNDIWLSPDKKNVYLPPDKLTKIRDFYKNKIIYNLTNNQADTEQQTSNWNKEKWDEEINKEYQKTEKKWNRIIKERNYDLWFEDNIGSFSVTISIKKSRRLNITSFFFHISIIHI